MTTIATQLDLVDSLLRAQYDANALEGWHAQERGGTFGAIKRAALKALTVTFQNELDLSERAARSLATKIYYSCIESGESASYVYALYITGE